MPFATICKGFLYVIRFSRPNLTTNLHFFSKISTFAPDLERMIVPVWTLATSCALKKHKVEFHHYRWNSHFLYTVCLRQIFRQRRLTCSLAKVFKLFTSVRLKSVKNSPSPKPTTSSTTFRKSSHFFEEPSTQTP